MAIIAIPYDRRYEQNFQGETKGESLGPCVICGKAIKAPGKYFVHVMNGGDSVCTSDEDFYVDDAGDLGLQPIGSDCLRRHPELKPYVRK